MARPYIHWEADNSIRTQWHARWRAGPHKGVAHARFLGFDTEDKQRWLLVIGVNTYPLTSRYECRCKLAEVLKGMVW